MTEEQIEKITDLLETFNFHKVKLALEVVDHRYYNTPWEYPEEAKIPSVRMLKDLVLSMSKTLFDNPKALGSDGSREVECFGFRLKLSKNYNLSLEFILTDYFEDPLEEC